MDPGLSRMYMDGFTPDAYARTGMEVTKVARGRRRLKPACYCTTHIKKSKKHVKRVGKRRGGARHGAMSKMSNKKKIGAGKRHC